MIHFNQEAQLIPRGASGYSSIKTHHKIKFQHPVALSKQLEVYLGNGDFCFLPLGKNPRLHNWASQVILPVILLFSTTQRIRTEWNHILPVLPVFFQCSYQASKVSVWHWAQNHPHSLQSRCHRSALLVIPSAVAEAQWWHSQPIGLGSVRSPLYGSSTSSLQARVQRSSERGQFHPVSTKPFQPWHWVCKGRHTVTQSQHAKSSLPYLMMCQLLFLPVSNISAVSSYHIPSSSFCSFFFQTMKQKGEEQWRQIGRDGSNPPNCCLR